MGHWGPQSMNRMMREAEPSSRTTWLLKVGPSKGVCFGNKGSGVLSTCASVDVARQEEGRPLLGQLLQGFFPGHPEQASLSQRPPNTAPALEQPDPVLLSHLGCRQETALCLQQAVALSVAEGLRRPFKAPHQHQGSMRLGRID